MNVFVRMLREVYGIHEPIVEAPPRIALRSFGGPFDIEQFRKQTNVCTIVTPPFVSYCMLVEERQPNENMGETSSARAQGHRGSVKGLRRPDSHVYVADDTLCMPQEPSMYQKFLEQKNLLASRGAASSQPTNDEVASEPKRQRQRGPTGATLGKGLGRYAQGP